MISESAHPVAAIHPLDGALPRPARALRSTAIALITFGIFPLVSWGGQWAAQINAERRLIGGAVDAIGPLASPEELEELHAAAEGATSQWLGGIVIGLCAIVITWFFILWLGREDLTFATLLDSTYRFHLANPNPQPWKTHLFTAWTIGLSVAYLTRWACVQWHVSRVRKLIRGMNRILDKHARMPIIPPQIGTGWSLRWVAAAAVMVACGGIWGIFAMMAGGAHRKYALSTGPDLRRILAAVAPVPSAVSGLICSNPLCQKRLPLDAAYCPRCGKRVD